MAAGIYSLDEHFNGQGRPQGLAGEAIPLYSRIALLAQVVDVFHTAGGRQAALDEVRGRAGGDGAAFNLGEDDAGCLDTAGVHLKAFGFGVFGLGLGGRGFGGF